MIFDMCELIAELILPLVGEFDSAINRNANLRKGERA